MSSTLRNGRRLTHTLLLAGLSFAGGERFALSQSLDALKYGFQNPPENAKPQVWWHWIDGNVSLDGAKLDLAWMKRVGIGGIHSFSGGGFYEPLVVKERVPFMSAEWQNIFRQTTQIARDSGMEVTIAGSPGWSETGGTWVTPEHAMMKYVWSETRIDGGTPLAAVNLALPPSTTGPFLGVSATRRGAPPSDLTHDVYQDALVVAFPTPPADLAVSGAVYTSSAGPIDLAPLRVSDLAHSVALPVQPGEASVWIQASFPQPVTIASIILGLSAPAVVDIEASDDGRSFHTLRHVEPDGAEHPCPQQTYAFSPITGRFFRVVLRNPPPAPPLPGLPSAFLRPPQPFTAFEITRLAFTGSSRVDRFESKAGFTSDYTEDTDTARLWSGGALAPKDVLDLTAKLRADGRLDWTPPPGKWTVLRFGYSLTGQTNGPAEASATGLEVDKLDAAMVREYLEHYLDLYSTATGGKLGAAGVQSLLTDSWEAGAQNWMPAMPSEFKRRAGYDLISFAPVLAGYVVRDRVSSERFLWDFRSTLKQMLAENHYGVLAQVLHEHGMSYYTEAEGDTPRAIGDGFAIKARSDIPTGEFWFRPFATPAGQPSLRADLEETASVAHLYGKQFAAAESLTVAAGNDPWAFSPGLQKPVADEIFAHGINRILLHESHHQPVVNGKPGLEMLFFGEFFNRNETWAEQAGPWISYLARTSYLLQQGKYVADVLYFYGEEKNLTQIFDKRFNTDVPEGYHYDYIDAEALLHLVHVNDGRLVTPSGMSYRVLYLPANVKRLTLPVLQKLRDLVASGAILIAPKPESGLGLASDDDAIRAIADELWTDASRSPVGSVFGKGRVYQWTDLLQLLQAVRVSPDVTFEGAAPAPKIMTLHRHLDGSDIYFLSNRDSVPRTLDATFRVKGMAPQLWHADTGTIEDVDYASTSRGTRVPLQLAADEAVFVVFHKSAQPSLTLPKTHDTTLLQLDGPWRLRFEPGRGAPEEVTMKHLTSWSDALNPGIKYFSGTATYTREITLPAPTLSADKRVRLDLGTVRDLATVIVNGKVVATLWHFPYAVDVTSQLHAGTNNIEIHVTNLWVNRLIGDKQPGATAYTFAPQSPYRSDSQLLPSGLLGPVQLISVDLDATSTR